MVKKWIEDERLPGGGRFETIEEEKIREEREKRVEKFLERADEEKQKQEDEDFNKWFNDLSEEERKQFVDIENEVVKDLED